MGFKLCDGFIEKISTPVVCKVGEKTVEFANGEACAKAEFEKPYVPADISIDGNKIVLTLEESGYVSKAPTYDDNAEWVKQHKKAFGTEPSFF